MNCNLAMYTDHLLGPVYSRGVKTALSHQPRLHFGVIRPPVFVAMISSTASIHNTKNCLPWIVRLLENTWGFVHETPAPSIYPHVKVVFYTCGYTPPIVSFSSAHLISCKLHKNVPSALQFVELSTCSKNLLTHTAVNDTSISDPFSLSTDDVASYPPLSTSKQTYQWMQELITTYLSRTVHIVP